MPASQALYQLSHVPSLVSHSHTPLWSQREVGEFQGKENFSVSLLGFASRSSVP